MVPTYYFHSIAVLSKKYIEQHYAIKKITKYLFFFLMIIFSLYILTSCTKVPEEKLLKLTGKTMGTTWNISYFEKQKKSSAHLLQSKIEKRLVDINQSMSTYIKDSTLSTFNYQDSQQPYAIDNELFNVIKAGINISQKSDGAFDFTVMPLVNLWGFGPNKSLLAPNTDTLNQALHNIGYQHIELIQSAKTIRKHKPEISIDLSAIAKGYAVDAIALLLDLEGIENYLVEIGGELKVKGKKPNTSWKVAIEKPTSGARNAIDIIPLHDLSIATSGDYRNFYMYQGKRVSHTINPKTGYPVEHKLASISVLHPSAMMADGWATALMVLGEDKGMQLANQLQLPVHMIIRKENSKTFEVRNNEWFARATSVQ